MLFFWTLYSSKNPKKKKNKYIDNNKNQYIRVISEGSCKTLDWSNDADNSDFHQRNKLYIFKQKIILNCNNIS